MKKIKPQGANVNITKPTHELLISYIEETGGKIGRFVDKAILEKLQREKDKSKKQS